MASAGLINAWDKSGKTPSLGTHKVYGGKTERIPKFGGRSGWVKSSVTLERKKTCRHPSLVYRRGWVGGNASRELEPRGRKK